MLEPKVGRASVADEAPRALAERNARAIVSNIRNDTKKRTASHFAVNRIDLERIYVAGVARCKQGRTRWVGEEKTAMHLRSTELCGKESADVCAGADDKRLQRRATTAWSRSGCLVCARRLRQCSVAPGRRPDEG
jgi:hypothetical protein